ncbi:hypothetical protein [Mucilaginibacter sp.]|uniref:hypothetical protein n=1 Tax=Mucilaginibacter sp. TaxID=1882438 RepID=UPI00261D5AD3|nr:hypothetical protein [Mucilaginibacter sp.]MDB5032378.1 hypothetical protein [Mucilaginibacter sp.]
MENTAYNEPKDDQITNDDTAVTNKDGDNDLEKGEQPTEQNNPDEERIPTVTPDNDNDDPEDENTSNKGQGPKGENL